MVNAMGDDAETLFHPTVADLIAALERFPKEAPVQLIDADTGWRIRKFHVGHTTSSGYDEIPGNIVYIWNTNYGDMDKP
jgi:hypothetical protein